MTGSYSPNLECHSGAVILDEISRCRPDIQNKLFPIIHERRVQGMLLDALRFRWAAMNPSCTEDDDNGYARSEPLDPALAGKARSAWLSRANSNSATRRSTSSSAAIATAAAAARVSTPSFW